MARSVLEIVFKVLKAGAGDQEAERGLRNLEKGVKSTIATFSAFAGVAAVVTKALNYSVREAMEAEKIQAKLNAVIKSTHGAAGMTASSLNTLADSLSRMSGIDDELITNSEAVMLTFTQIGSQVFPQAMEAALNMNAVLGGDLQQSVIQLGKALNVTAGDTQTASLGLTAMRRTGVSFTEEQKKMALEMIRVGDVIGYQKLILSELNTEFGGAARAMGDTTAGSANKLKVSIDNLAESVGTDLLPKVKELTDEAIRLVDWITVNKNAIVEWGGRIGWVVAFPLKLANVLSGLFKNLIDGNKDLDESKDAFQEWAAGEKDYIPTIQGATQAIQEQADAIDAISRANQDMLGLIFQLQTENDNYNQSLDEVNAKYEDAKFVQDLYKQSKAELLAQANSGTITWDEYRTKVDDVNSAYADGSFAAEHQQEAVEALAQKHEEASRRIVFSLLQQKLAVGGLEDDEFAFLLDTGVKWGLIDAKVAESALLLDANATAMAESLQDPKGELAHILDQTGRMENRSGSSWDFFVNIHTKGAFPSFGGGAGGGSGGGAFNVIGGSFDERHDTLAGGGDLPLGEGWAVVGERGFELIDPSGHVWTNEESRLLMNAGLIPSAAFGMGGSLEERQALTSGYKPNFSFPSAPKPRKSSSSLSPTVVKSEISQASNAAVATAVAAEETSTEAVRSSAAAQKQAAVEAARTQAVISEGNAEMVAQQRETNRLLKDQQKTMTRSLVSAMQQAAP